MNKKTVLLITSLAILTNLAIASISSPGLSDSGESGEVVQEIEINRGWNNIAVNVDGATLEDSKGTCQFEEADWDGYSPDGVDERAYIWRTADNDLGFEPVDLDEELDPTVGYTVGVLEGCTLEFEGGATPSASTERTLHGNMWNLVTLPPETAPNDILNIVEQEDEVDLYKYPEDNGDYFHVHEGQDSGEEVWTNPTDSLADYKSVWVAPTNDITINFDTSEIGSIGPGGDPDDEEESSDNEDGSDIETGDLYFWSDARGGVVNNEAGSPDDSPNYEYQMSTDYIHGAFTSHGSGERTVEVTNLDTGASDQNTDSGNYVGMPGSSDRRWGSDQSDLFRISGETTFRVKVYPAGSDQEVQEADFTLIPPEEDSSDDDSNDDSNDDGDDDSDDSRDRSEEELGDLSFEIRPDPSEWTDDSNDRVSCHEETRSRRGYSNSWDECEVDAEFEAEAGEGYIDQYRVEADINNEGFDNDPSPFSYECEGPDWTSCYVSHTNTVDTRDIDSYSAWIEVQDYECSGYGRSRRCSWETIDRAEYDDFE